MSSHLNQNHQNTELVQHKGLLSLYSSPFPPAALSVSSFQVMKCQDLSCPEEGDIHPLEETEKGRGANQRFESESYFSRGILLTAQAVTAKLLSVKICLATCLRRLLPDLLSVHFRAWEEKPAAECPTASATYT